MEKQQTVVHIGGMDCANCANSISNLLQKKGLTDIQVNFATGEAYYTPVDKISFSEVKSSIESLGYKVLDGQTPSKNIISSDVRLIIAAIFTLPLLLHMVPGFSWLQNPFIQFALCVPVLLIGIIQFGKSAYTSIINWFPNMDVLVFTGFSAAFIYSLIGTFYVKEESHHYLFYETTASIITLVLLGNYIEQKAVKKASSSIEAFSKIKPSKARIIIKFGDKEKTLETEIKNLKPGDLVQVVSGERIPADGIVIDGNGFINQGMFTGEHEPVYVDTNKHVIGGSVLTEGIIKIQVEKTGEEAYLNRLIDLVKKASFNKPSIQKIGDKISAVFVPVVIIVAVSTFFVARFIFDLDNFHAVMNAIAVLVISCPCAMGLATPTAVMVGIGRSARNGIIIRGGDTLQAFADAKTFLFDKTGTLTTGKFKVQKIEIHKNDFSESEINSMIRSLELKSVHPIAQFIAAALSDYPEIPIGNFEEMKGVGVKGKANGKELILGSERVLHSPQQINGARFYLLINGEKTASVFLEEDIKPGAEHVMASLKNDKIDTMLLSGDTDSACRLTAASLGIQNCFSGLMPHEKLEKIEREKVKGSVVMVGDGINDAPSLTAAHVGISFSGSSDIALQSANVILLTQDITKILEARKYAVQTLRTIKQNLFWAFCYNLVAIPLAAMGFLNPMWGAAFMAFSDIMVIGNSIRLNYKRI